MTNALQWVAVPVVPTFEGVVKKLHSGIVQPTEKAGKQAAKSIEKSASDSVSSLEKQVAASSGKLEKLDRAYDIAASKRQAQQHKLNAALAEQTAAEQKYQDVLRSGGGGAAELAKLERAKAKVTDETIKMEAAEQAVQDAEKAHARQLKDLKDTTERYEKAQAETTEELGNTADAMEKAEKRSALFDKSMTAIAASAAAVVAGVGALGTAAYELGAQFDDVYDTIRVGTGATGEVFESLQGTFRTVAGEYIGVGDDFAAIGSTIADLNTRLGYTGEPLEKLSAQFLQLKNMGMEADINAVTGAFTQFGVEAEQAPAMMDTLFQISQATGRGINDLVANLSKSGPALQEFGFGLEESAGLLGALDKAGLDSEKTLGSMTKALGVFAEEGKNPSQALWETIASIEELTQAGKNAEAIDLANSIFGAKGGVGFVAAVESGKFAYDDFLDSIGATSDTINGLAEETADFSEVWAQYKNKALLALEPIAMAIFDSLVPALEQLWDWGVKAVEMFQQFGEWAIRSKDWLLPLVAGIAAGVAAWVAWNTAIAAYNGVIKIATAVQAAFNAVMAANPIMLIVIAVAALTAGLVVFFTKTETGRELWAKFTQALATGWQWVVDTVTAGWAWLNDNVFAPLGRFWGETLWPVISQVLTWVIDKWNAFKDVVALAWFIIRDQALNPFGGFMTTVLWPMVQSVLNWIGDKWRAMATGFTWVKDNVIIPVFDAMGQGLDRLKNWFKTVVDAISRIWDGIRAAAARPVKFIIDTVINKGIFAGWNKVAGLVGLDEVKSIPLGSLGAFARGGMVNVLPGYTPGRDPYTLIDPRYGLAIGLSGGEAVIRPEGTAELGTAWVDGINAAAKRGGRPAVRRWLGRFAGGGVIDSITSIVREKFPMMTITSTFRPGDPGWHGQGKAVDFSNGFDTTPQMQAAARYFAENYGSELLELIHSPFGGNVKNGQSVGDGFGFYGAGTMNEHRNHVHIAAAAPLAGGKGGVLGVLEGFVQSAGAMVKGMWDKIINAIPGYKGAGEFAKIPGEFLKKASEAVWNFLKDKVGSSSTAGAFMGDPGAGVEQWRGLVVSILKAKGFDPILADTVLRRMNQESGGNARAINNWDINAVNGTPSKGLMQVIDPTFQAHKDPGYDDIWDPESNIRASMNYAVSRYGSLPAAYNRPGGYADGGIIELAKLLGATKFDVGGVWKHGTIGVNLSGEDEFVLKNSGMRSLGDIARAVGDLVPELKNHTEVIAKQIEVTAEFLQKAADPESDEGIMARALAAEFSGIFGELGFDGVASVTDSLLGAEKSLLDARSAHAERLEDIKEKEKAYEEAKKNLAKITKDSTGLTKEHAESVQEAEKALEKAREGGDTEKIAEAEKKLADTREEATKKSSEEVKKATDDMTKAEADLVAARKKSVASLDMPLHSLVPQISEMATAAAEAASAAGLGALVPALSQVAVLAGPAGISVGVALTAVKAALSVVKTIFKVITGFFDKLYKSRVEARKAMADAYAAIAEYATLVFELQENTSKLQQSLVRSLNEQRAAEFALRVAQQDRLVAEAESIVNVAKARLELDKELKKGAVAAQIRLKGLHEDWDSYRKFEADIAKNNLQRWSDAAISALYSYEAARAKALQSELQARLDQIKAEAALAEATRTVTRNQQDLLLAQERLIRMSAKVAGVDLEDAVGTSTVAKLLTEMAEVRAKLDSNVLGRIGSFFGGRGAISSEYRGHEAQLQSLRDALTVVMKETGVSLDSARVDQVLALMAKAVRRGGDPLAVLRSQLPELVAAETALKIDQSLKPVFEARESKKDLERQVEDFKAEIDLHTKTAPLEEVIKGLGYTVSSLEKSAEAWAKENRELRGEYLHSADAAARAARELGVSWQYDEKYFTGELKQHVAKHVTIYLEGNRVYTDDQVAELLDKATKGSNVTVAIKKSATTVAQARRKEAPGA